jgi:hypothetical protein
MSLRVFSGHIICDFSEGLSDKIRKKVKRTNDQLQLNDKEEENWRRD